MAPPTRSSHPHRWDLPLHQEARLAGLRSCKTAAGSWPQEGLQTGNQESLILRTLQPAGPGLSLQNQSGVGGCWACLVLRLPMGFSCDLPWWGMVAARDSKKEACSSEPWVEAAVLAAAFFVAQLLSNFLYFKQSFPCGTSLYP